MEPNIWGPHAWIFLHTTTFNYPKKPTQQDKINMINFFKSVSQILPCKICQTHFKKNLEQYPLTHSILKNRDGLVRWLIQIHNNVNLQTGKNIYSYDDVILYYKNLDKNLDKFKITKNKIAMFCILCIIIYLVIIWKR